MGLFRTNYIKLSDEELMEHIAKRDERAFSVLYDRYSSRIMNYFFRMLWQDREKSEDFTHDLFTKIIDRPESFDVKRNFKTWIFSIANNMCKNEYKKQAVRSNTSTGLEDVIVADTETISQPDRLDKNKFHETLKQELELLDEKHRSTFILRFEEELSIKEISKILDCSEGTVKSRIFYTLKRLAPRLKAFDPKQNELAYG